jgi:hypothetical protein
LDQLKQSVNPWDFSGQINLGVIHDDNVNFGPSSKTIESLLGPLEVASNAYPSTAWGGVASGMLLGSYDFGQRRYWQAVGGLAGYQNWLNNSTEQEIGFYRAQAGLRRVDFRTMLDLPLKYDHLDYGHESLLDIVGAEPSLLLAPSLNWNYVTRLAFEQRYYQDGSDRDGPYGRFYQTVRRFFGFSRHSLSLSAGYFIDDSDLESYANEGFEIDLSAEINVLTRNMVYGSVDYRDTEYDEVQLPGIQADARSDEQWQFTIGARSAVTPRCSLDANYRHINNKSNFGLYNYDRNIVAVSTIVTF